MSWIPSTTFPPALTEVLGVTLTMHLLTMGMGLPGEGRSQSIISVRADMLSHFSCLCCVLESGLAPAACPGGWGKFLNLVRGRARQAAEHVAQVRVGIDAVSAARFNDRVDDRGADRSWLGQ